MSDAVLLMLSLMRQDMQHFASMVGARLTRSEVCDRLGIHRNTLARYADFPKPGRDGKWLLSEVMDWEIRR